MKGFFGTLAALTALCALGLLVGGHSSLAAPDEPAADWPGVGGPAGETHFARQRNINEATVSRLGLKWSLDLPGEHTLEATPLEVAGTLYFSGQNSAVYAVDALTGKLNWKYDPHRSEFRPQHLRLIFPANRGVAFAHGKVIVGTLDGRLVALDAKSGAVAWDVKTVADDSFKTITGAPRIMGNKVVIGNGGGDAGERAYVTAYDVDTGTQAWRFFIVPGDPAKGFEEPAMQAAAATWSGKWWEVGTGGSAWDSMVYDAELKRLYIGTGNSGPYNPRVRNPAGGDDLYLASIVAIDAETGKYIWHYQVNPNEAWDFKATANIIMADISIAGTPRKVLMQSPTNGFFYVLDRTTGKLISAGKTGKVTWADRIDVSTGRPVEAPNIRYADGPVTFWPSPYGTHNWQPMAFSQDTHLVYIPTMQLGARFETDKQFEEHPARRGIKAPFASGTLIQLVQADANDGTGALVAWDPVIQKSAWTVKYPHMWNGGVLATAGGLVFHGDGEGHLHAYDAKSGKSLWDFDAKLGIIGAPISFSIADVQYISILVGYGGASGFNGDFASPGWKYNAQPRRLLTFALDARGVLPPTPPRNTVVTALDDSSLVIDESAVGSGAMAFGNGCVMCHGMGARSAGVPGPDLRESSLALDPVAFSALLRSGALAVNGMPKFDDYSDAEIHAMYTYIRAAARVALGKRPPGPADMRAGGG